MAKITICTDQSEVIDIIEDITHHDISNILSWTQLKIELTSALERATRIDEENQTGKEVDME